MERCKLEISSSTGKLLRSSGNDGNSKQPKKSSSQQLLTETLPLTVSLKIRMNDRSKQNLSLNEGITGISVPMPQESR